MGNVKSSKNLTESDLTELADTTYFSKNEIKNWHQHFLKDCPSGQLKKEEFQNIYKQVFPEGNPARFAGFVFNVFDKNLDGSINFKEFITALSVTARGNMDEKLEWAFSLYDIDRDGHISRDEMVSIVSAIYEMIGDEEGKDTSQPAEDRANQIFEHLDCNHDGLLSIEEFRTGAKSDPWIVHALAMDTTALKNINNTTNSG